MADQAAWLASEKLGIIQNLYYEYNQSLETSVQFFDKNYPIRVTASVSSSVSESGFMLKTIP